MPYDIQRGRVLFDGKAVRNADAETFGALRDGWGRDAESVYRNGRKVPRADPDTFNAWSGQTGADRKYLFYLAPGGGEMVHQRRPLAVDGSSRLVEADGLTFFAAGDQLWIGGGYGLLGPLPLATDALVSLGQRYLKDHERVYWFDDRGSPEEVVGADASSFVVDETGACDRSGRFVGASRDDGLRDVQREIDPARAAADLLRSVWNETLPRWFALFDGKLPNDEPVWSSPRPPPAPTAVPAHELEIDGGSMVLTAAGRTTRGRASAMELLAGWLFGVARGKHLGDLTVIRILPGADALVAARDGDPPAWERTLDLAYLLDRLGQRDDARFLARAVLRAHRYVPVGREPMSERGPGS